MLTDCETIKRKVCLSSFKNFDCLWCLFSFYVFLYIICFENWIEKRCNEIYQLFFDDFFCIERYQVLSILTYHLQFPFLLQHQLRMTLKMDRFHSMQLEY